MGYDYTNEELAKRYLSLILQRGYSSRSQRNISSKIKSFGESISGCFSSENSLDSLKVFSSKERRILELILTEGDKARDTYYKEIVEEERKKCNFVTGGHRRGSYIQNHDDNPWLENNVRILEG